MNARWVADQTAAALSSTTNALKPESVLPTALSFVDPCTTGSPPSFTPIAMEHSTKVNFKARNLILDYALGAAIIALLPLPQVNWLKAIALLGLNLFLVIGIARLWNFKKGGDVLARIGILFGIVGAIGVGILGWLLLVIGGVMVPMLGSLAPGMAAFSYFWGFGQTVHHFYISKAPKMQANSLEGQDDEG